MIVAGLCALLGREFEIAGVAYTGDELLALLRECAADCLLLDLMMPGHNGLELIPEIRSLRPQMSILVVTMLLDRGIAKAALAAGASGFIPKDASIADLKGAIGEVLAGRRYLSPRLPKTTHRLSLESRHVGLHRLTARQQQIVLLLGEGKSETEIARALGLGLSTITFHKRNLMRELGIETDGGLMKYAVLVRAEVEGNQLSNPL